MTLLAEPGGPQLQIATQAGFACFPDVPTSAPFLSHAQVRSEGADAAKLIALDARWITMTRLAFLLPLLALWLPQVAAAAETVAPFSPQQRAILQAIPEDPAPKVLLGQAPGLENKHYVVGNEWHLYLYGDKLKDLGGSARPGDGVFLLGFRGVEQAARATEVLGKLTSQGRSWHGSQIASGGS